MNGLGAAQFMQKRIRIGQASVTEQFVIPGVDDVGHARKFQVKERKPAQVSDGKQDEGGQANTPIARSTANAPTDT